MPPRQVVRDDRRADAALQVALREGIPLQEAEGIDAEEGRVGQHHLRVEVPAAVLRLDVGIPCELPGTVLRGDGLRILQVQRPVLQGRIGQGGLPLAAVALEAGVGQVQRAAAVHLRIDRGELHVHNHRHGNGQPGARDVQPAEERVLAEQGPGLFQVQFNHTYKNYIVH